MRRAQHSFATTTSRHNVWASALTCTVSRATALGRSICWYAGAWQRATDGSGPSPRMHHETPASTCRSGRGHAAEPGALPRVRLTLQTQWSPKSFSVSLCFACTRFRVACLRTTPARYLPFCSHSSGAATMVAPRRLVNHLRFRMNCGPWSSHPSSGQLTLVSRTPPSCPPLELYDGDSDISFLPRCHHALRPTPMTRTGTFLRRP